MRNLNYDFKNICRRNRDGSFATQADRSRLLDLMAKQLHEMRPGDLRAHNLKPRHIDMLVKRWQSEGLSAGTLKNRMTALRWLVEKLGKQNIVQRSNAAYAIPDRVYVTNVSKAKVLDAGKLETLADPFAMLSLRFQALFGLRREESIKIIPAWADRADRLLLKASWTKGGREREIPVRTLEQRKLIDEAKVLADGKSLVAPGYSTYRDYLAHFRYVCERAGIHQVHGHRHYYAQGRYRELTGWACPACGGPRAKQLSATQRTIDRDVRVRISHELGHGREQITAVYLGR